MSVRVVRSRIRHGLQMNGDKLALDTFSSDKREAPRVNRRGWRCAAGPNFRRNYVKPLMIT